MTTKIVNYMAPGAGALVVGCGHINYIVKMHYFFKNLFLYFQAYIRQSKYIVMITKEGYTKIVNFMTPGAKRGHISHYSEYVYYLQLYQYTLIAIVLREYDATFPFHS